VSEVIAGAIIAGRHAPGAARELFLLKTSLFVVARNALAAAGSLCYGNKPNDGLPERPQF
jgi:hypothetical protein